MQTASVVLAHRVEEFEAALACRADADLAEYLPDPSDSQYLQVLTELVRVDLEHGWSNDRKPRVNDYRRFPEIFENPSILAAVAFEEYRLRRRAGELVAPEQYRSEFRVDTSQWPNLADSMMRESELLLATHAVSAMSPATNRVAITPNAALPNDPDTDSLGPRVSALPEPGADFLGFHLLEELGRGAYGCVYLAQQGDLAARPVALKVACDLADESHKLAQLQHTNIVPIYSFHRVGELQAACMPYFGRTTLAHVLLEVSGKDGLPSSGRELKSTVNRRGPHDTTARPGDSSVRPAKPGGVPAETASQAPATPGPADGWAKLEGLSYVEAVLWIGEQLAAGLAHAHERGILHRDLKPANVLLTDEGRPMLLDFNLAEDMKARGTMERAWVGGTIPYMAPEHLEAFSGAGPRTLDGRCDVFSLGVILFELLTGRHPYPVHKLKAKQAVTAMLADRRHPAPGLRRLNPAVSLATEAIVQKCLAGDPTKRYQTAQQLREDLDRQLNGQPLKYAAEPSRRERARKWAKRHPRLSSSGAVAALAALLLIGVGAGAVYSRERAHDFQAKSHFQEHRAAFGDAQLAFDDRHQSAARSEEAIGRFRGILGRYELRDEPNDGWLGSEMVRRLPETERQQLRADLGESYFLMAEVSARQASAIASDSPERERLLQQASRWHANAERYAGDRVPFALRGQARSIEDWLHNRPGAPGEADPDPAAIDSPRDLYLLGARLTRSGEHLRSIPYLQKATQLDPKNFSAWFVCGTAHLELAQFDMAAICFASCLAIRDDFAPAWLNRGRAFNGLRYFDRAQADFDEAIRLNPQLVDAYINRAIACDALFDPKGAEANFTQSLETGAAPVRVYFLRADVRRRLGREAEADADRDAGLKLRPADELSWVGRGEMRLGTDPVGALADVEEALKLNAFSKFGLQLKAHILAEPLHRPAEAIAVLDRAVQFHPDFATLRAGRGVLLARAGQRGDALRDARDALRRDTRPPNLYQVGCIYALTSAKHPEDRAEANRLLWDALRTGYGVDIVDGDTDLDPLRKDMAFQELVSEAKRLDASRRKRKTD